MVLIARRALAATATLLIASFAHSDPFPVRDQNPLLAGFALPGALPAQLPQTTAWSFDTSFAWGSSAIVQTNPRETLMVDAETQELSVAFERTFANGYAVRAELPYRRTSAGVLDGFIDDWHDAFGLPEGARPALPHDALRLAYARDGRQLVDTRTTHSGIGDVSLQLGKRLGAPITAWLSLKLPTGDADDFTGSGSVDVMAALAFERTFGARYAVFAQAAGTYLGEGDRLASQQKSAAWSGMIGLSARTIGELTLTAQVDAHTAVFESDEDFLGDAVMLTIGGSYRFAKAWDLSFAVIEDIAVESAPDVVFLFELKRSAR